MCTGEQRQRAVPYRGCMDKDMNTRNPVLAREAAQYAKFNVPAASPQQLQDMYDAPSAPASLDRVAETADDPRRHREDRGDVRRSSSRRATVSWNLVTSAPWLVWGALIGGLILGIVNAVKRVVSPPLILLYAAVEGVFLGGLSWLYNEYYGTGAGNANIVGQAIVGTFVAFGVMLALYASGKLRATPRFKKMMMVALVSYLVIAVVQPRVRLPRRGQWLGLLRCRRARPAAVRGRRRRWRRSASCSTSTRSSG